jgi:hypothetical protein
MSSSVLQFFESFKSVVISKTEESGFFEVPMICGRDAEPIAHWDSVVIVSLKSADTKLCLSIHYNLCEMDNLILHHDRLRELANLIAGGLKDIYKTSGLGELKSTLPGQTFGFLYSTDRVKDDFPENCCLSLDIGSHSLFISLAASISTSSLFQQNKGFKASDSTQKIQKLRD